MRRSNAGSKFAARFVAKITTPLKASSSRRRTLTTVLDSRSYGTNAFAERRVAIASASSKNNTALCSAAERKAATMFFGVSPIHIDSTSA